MAEAKNIFKDVTLLITHYNRSSSLERLLRTFAAQDCFFEDIVVSDDGSRPEHLDQLKKLQEELRFQLVTTPKNAGLGNNINKGQDAVKTPYTLYVQEDFEPDPTFAAHFSDALAFMNDRKDFDIVKFYAYYAYPYLKPFAKGFSEMRFKPWYPGYTKIYMYSDHPHLRRSNFFEKFGRYPEGMSGDNTEYRMCISFLQHKGKGLFYDDFQSLFHQKNSSAEPSTMHRNYWRESNNGLVKAAREGYRHFKFIYHYFFQRNP